MGISTYQEETLRSEELDQEGKVENIEERGAYLFPNYDDTQRTVERESGFTTSYGDICDELELTSKSK